MGLSKSRTPGHFRHSIVMTGKCTNSNCRRSLKVPHSFDAPMGWAGRVETTAECPCGTTSTISAHSG